MPLLPIILPRKIAAMRNMLGVKVVSAYKLAEKIHRGQKRKTGEKYIVHPIDVAFTLFEIGADEDVICAALLHDALEDGHDVQALRDDIYRDFGDHVLYLVEAVSKNTDITDKGLQQEAYLEQIQRAFALDIFVFFIKVADLLDNMRTISALSPERTAQWVKELKFQYLPLFSDYFPRIPLAHRDMYLHMLDTVQSTIAEFEKTEANSSRPS